MNKLQLQKQRNDVSRLIRPANRVRNALRWSKNETTAHIFTKLKICMELQDQDRDFYTEAIFEQSGLRADVIDADMGIIYEIVESESEESIEKKRKEYPLPIIVIKAQTTFNKNKKLTENKI